MIGRRWSGIWRRRGWCGGGQRGCSAGRGRGRRCPDFLQICCSVGAALWCGGVGGQPPNVTGPRGFPVPGGAAIDGTAPSASVRQEVGLNLGGGGEGGGGV